MVSQALQPRATSQMVACVWLNDFAQKYGDHVPNRPIIYLPAMSKKDLWERYLEYTKDTQQSSVVYSRFLELWNSIYPTYQLRDEANIIGKCVTCYEITNARKTTDEAVLEACKILHALHGGGCFKRERERYIL